MAQLNVLGLDPGVSGGVALIRFDPTDPGLNSAEAWKMPPTERDLFDLLEPLGGGADGAAVAYLERVAARPGQGVSSTFKFGTCYGMLRGMLRGMLIALKISFECVTPGVWQRRMGCLSGGDKRVTKDRAQELFPQLRVTHAVADALLIAE